MIIEPVVGIQKKDTVLSEKEFPSSSIFSTASMLRDYFKKYGYHFIGFYNDSEDLVVVKDNNQEVSILTGDYDTYQVYNYKTGKVVIRNLNLQTATEKYFPMDKITILSFTHRIESTPSGMRLIHNGLSTTVLEGESMTFFFFFKVLVTNYGLESIYSISEGRNYPLEKAEAYMYIGANSNQFIDMRFDMYVTFRNTIMPVRTKTVDLFDIVRKYPYGERRGTHFMLIASPIKHGIFYQNEDNSYTKWYDSSDERNQVLSSLGILVEKTLAKEPVKVKKD